MNESGNRLLLDGSEAADAQSVADALTALDLDHRSVIHLPMRTVADSRALRDGLEGGFSKNLFLRNKKGRMLLVTLREDRTVDLAALGRALEFGKPSFASEQRLMHYLGVIPGAVTPLAVINDKSKSVVAVLDKALLEMDPLHFHPCDNTMTTTISAESLLTYMQHYHREPTVYDFDAPAAD